MTVVYSSKRLRWMAFWVFVFLFGGAFPSQGELFSISDIDALIDNQNRVCSMIEKRLEAKIAGLYGVPQDLQIPNEVVQDLRSRYTSSNVRTDSGVRNLDEALFACTMRPKYQRLLDKIYEGVYPKRSLSSD